MGSLQEAKRWEGARVFDLVDRAQGTKAAAGERTVQVGASKGGSKKGTKKKAGKLFIFPKNAKQDSGGGQASGSEATMAADAMQLGAVAGAAENNVVQRAQEARKKAGETTEESMRTRIAEVEFQARAAWRDLFKDLVIDIVVGDNISTAWIAKYVARHGFS